MQIKLIFIWMVSHETRFENEAKGNSEVAHLDTVMRWRGLKG